MSPAIWTLIGAGLGSPVGVIAKLPTIPSTISVSNSDADRARALGVAGLDRLDQDLGRLARVGREDLDRPVADLSLELLDEGRALRR